MSPLCDEPTIVFADATAIPVAPEAVAAPIVLAQEESAHTTTMMPLLPASSSAPTAPTANGFLMQRAEEDHISLVSGLNSSPKYAINPTTENLGYNIAETALSPVGVDMKSEYVECVEPFSNLDQPGSNYSMDQKHRIALTQRGYTGGLAKSIFDAKNVFAKRIWIIDNSGSMQSTDGHRMIEARGQTGPIRTVPCSRWEEIQECVNYHVKVAGALKIPTSFRLLNDPGRNAGEQVFGVAEHPESDVSFEVQQAIRVMRMTRPGGCTPLTSHILEIHREVRQMAPTLRANGQKVAIVIATDGLPTGYNGYGGYQHKREFVDSLRLLEGLPVWVIIRLCTDDDDVVSFYNDLDCYLELSIEVLDDFIGEAKEIRDQNPWLNYALPLHRLREMGHHDRVFDMLDERLLTKSELYNFCVHLFGEKNFVEIADPTEHWDEFMKGIERLQSNTPHQWDPLRKRMRPWIDLRMLNSIYARDGIWGKQTLLFGCLDCCSDILADMVRNKL